MNILLINHYAGSPQYGMEFRPYYMAREWMRYGNKVLVLGGSFSHLRKKQPSKEFENLDGVDYSWVSLNRYRGNGVGRVISMFLFVVKIFVRYMHYLQGFIPDVVIASSTYPIDIYPARKISVHFNAKLIYEVHDLWPLSPMELGGYSKNHPFIKIMQYAENYAYGHVDAVVSMLPKAEVHMKKHGLAEGKFFYVPNGVVKEDWEKLKELPNEHETLLNELKDEGKCIVGYTGAHGIANSLYSIINAVSSLVKENVVLVLVGTGQEKSNLIEYVKKKNFTNVFFLPPLTKLEVPALLDKMDILYIGLQKQSLFRFGISPNKIFDYMMASKPIIQAITAGNNLVQEAKCGLYVEPDNVTEIKKAILAIMSMSQEDKLILGSNGKNFVEANHTYNVLGKKFLDIMIKIS